MRKLFLRYFLSIFLIAAFTLLIMCGCIFGRYEISKAIWQKDIFSAFVDSVSDSLSDSIFPDFSISNLRAFMNSFDDDRVCGYMISDENGNLIMSMGKTSDGRLLASLLPAGGNSCNALETTVSTTVLNVVIDQYGFEVQRDVEHAPKSVVYLPSQLTANDIIGSVTVRIQGKTFYVIHLLSYTPLTYAYTKELIGSIFEIMVYSLPICLLIAAVASWIISKKNAGYIDEIRTALTQLSNGKTGVGIKHQRNAELNDIAYAIEDLDAALVANAANRKAWLDSISHDLNTPASAVRMLADGFADGVIEPNEENLQSLCVEANNLTSRIGRVIEYSDLRSMTATEVQTVEAVSFFSDIVDSEEDYINVDCKINRTEIPCDYGLMKRAVRELLNNAITANRQADGTSNVNLSFNETDGKYSICIVNSGILPDEPEKLLDPLVRGDKSRHEGGNGLGLPMVNEIARIHGGKLELRQNGDKVEAVLTWSV